MRPQPLIAVHDLKASRHWYQALLVGAEGDLGE